MLGSGDLIPLECVPHRCRSYGCPENHHSHSFCMSSAAKAPSIPNRLGPCVEQAKWAFALPDGARRLVASGDFDGRDNDSLIRWLSTDPELSRRLLRWCNSPLYALSQPYRSLTDVLQIMDRAELARLALLAFVRGLFEGNDRLWAHSIAVGAVGSMISRTCDRADSGLVFVAGALHDIGLCAHHRLAPQAYAEVLAEVDDLSATHEVERERLGWDHTELGAAILRQWGLPAAIVEPARYHHAAGCAEETGQAETVACVAIANYLCSRAGWSSTGCHYLLPPSKEVLGILGIDSGLLSVIWQQLAGSLESVTDLR